jgi:hypothetical protein
VKHSISFSPDSKRIAYVARDKDQWFMVVDGKEGNRFDEILKYSPVFSPDSKRVAYAARDKDQWFVIEEIAEKNTQNKDQISFSPAQAHLATLGYDDVGNQTTISKTGK